MATNEEPVVVPTEPVPEVPVSADESVKEENPQAKSAKAKKPTNAAKPKKVPAPRKRGPAAHPPYFEVLIDPKVINCLIEFRFLK